MVGTKDGEEKLKGTLDGLIKIAINVRSNLSKVLVEFIFNTSIRRMK